MHGRPTVGDSFIRMCQPRVPSLPEVYCTCSASLVYVPGNVLTSPLASVAASPDFPPIRPGIGGEVCPPGPTLLPRRPAWGLHCRGRACRVHYPAAAPASLAQPALRSLTDGGRGESMDGSGYLPPPYPQLPVGGGLGVVKCLIQPLQANTRHHHHFTCILSIPSVGTYSIRSHHSGFSVACATGVAIRRQALPSSVPRNIGQISKSGPRSFFFN
ncbi:hypothetical protein B0T19DRAFT_126328 [Cercophora scortea]|uniref:Uncharacterized protein n=1 Tax=Cercophora scortea TaxID=314031 RepID=A0AAE0IYC0_9PEZI|nr:hypothetical protein B0T19DRAFT_126328 [Cercophora scortea]